jgi:hypothetical protein
MPKSKYQMNVKVQINQYQKSLNPIIEYRISKGILYLFLMSRGDFSRPDFGRLKPPLPKANTPINKFHYFCEAQYFTSFTLDALIFELWI